MQISAQRDDVASEMDYNLAVLRYLVYDISERAPFSLRVPHLTIRINSIVVVILVLMSFSTTNESKFKHPVTRKRDTITVSISRQAF